MISCVIRRKVVSFQTTLSRTNFQKNLSTSESAQLTPEAVLNNEVRTACIRRLKLIKITKNTEDNPNKAAVLVPLCIHNGKLGLLYTLRSHKVSANRGQVSFPGGMKDQSDKTLEATALRETWEELQISKDAVDVWGSGNFIERKHVSVLPVVGFVGEIDPKKLQINKNEVEEAFVYPLEKLCDPTLCKYTQFRNNYTLPLYLGGDYKIWGLTAQITHMVMGALMPGIYKHKVAYIPPILAANKQQSSMKKSF